MHQPSPAQRCLSRTGSYAQWAFFRLSYLLGLTYALLIAALIVFVAYQYVHVLRPLLATVLQPHFLAAHTSVSVLLFVATATNYIAAVVTPAGSPPGGADAAPEQAAKYSAVHVPDNADAVRTNSEMWRYCKICRGQKPPRTHHCSACGICVLKLCHHCPAMARCIGLRNYAFYFRFITAAWAGSLFLSVTCMWLQKCSPRTLSPIMADVIFFTMIISASVAVAVGVLTTWHVYLLLTGQTTIECYENWAVRRRGAAPSSWTRWGGPFDAGLCNNVRDAFGDPPLRMLPWWSVLLIPLPRRLTSENGVF